MKKKYLQRKHAKTRMWERFGINLNGKEYKKLVSLIQKGQATFLERQSNRLSVFLLEYNNKKITVIYDSVRHNIVTALPLDEENSHAT